MDEQTLLAPEAPPRKQLTKPQIAVLVVAALALIGWLLPHGEPQARPVEATPSESEVANRPPTLRHILDMTITEGDQVSLRLVATDPEAGGLRFTADGLPEGPSVHNTGRISGSPDEAGVFAVDVTVSDGEEEATRTFRVDVVAAPAPAPPTPAPAPVPAPVSGGNVRFDQLQGECGDGNQHSCDLLYSESPVNSDYEDFALAHGGTFIPREEREAGSSVALSPDLWELAGDLFWDGLSATEQAELCGHVRTLGLDLAATAFIGQTSDLSLEQARTALQSWCL